MVEIHNLWRPIVGGVILAVASSLNLILKGRVTGFSGIIYGAFTLNDYLWRITFILGIFITSNLFYALSNDQSYFDSHNAYLSDLSLMGFFISGLFVGVGTKLSNGCTSGHGLCGLARLSPRSILAVVTFLSFAIASCTFRSNYPFFNTPDLLDFSKSLDIKILNLILSGLFTVLLIFLLIKFYRKNELIAFYDVLISFIIGSLMALGLIISGMNKRTKVRDFLNLNIKTWDPTLLILLGVAVSLNMLIYFYLIKRRENPILGIKFGIPSFSNIDLSLIMGSAIFGIGWGWSGICPGPALVDLFIYFPHVILFLFAMTIGQFSVTYSIVWFTKIKNIHQKNLLNENLNR